MQLTFFFRAASTFSVSIPVARDHFEHLFSMFDSVGREDSCECWELGGRKHNWICS